MVVLIEELVVERALLFGNVCWRYCWMWRSCETEVALGDWFLLRLLVGAFVWRGGGEVVLGLR